MLTRKNSTNTKPRTPDVRARWLLESWKNDFNIKEDKDWYNVLTTDVKKKKGGRSLVNKYKNIGNILSAAFPENIWILSEFKHIPRKIWGDPKNVRDFFESKKDIFGIQKPEDWYNVTRTQLQQFKGQRLLMYHGHICNALSVAYPDQKWFIGKFKCSPTNIWQNQKNVREFFEEIKEKMKITKMEDWYNVTRSQIEEVDGGYSVCRHFGNLGNALKFAYPEFSWILGRFRNPPHDIWEDQKNLKDFLDFCKQELCIEKPEDWGRVSFLQISKFGGANLVKYYGSLKKALEKAYPELEWNNIEVAFSGKKSRQRKILPPSTVIIEEYKHPLLIWEGKFFRKKINFQGINKSGPMQIDVWIPQYNLAIEYQGEQHYHDMNTAFGPGGILAMYTERDLVKKKTASEKGIRFLAIPYWWDGEVPSLEATLNFNFPDLFPLSKTGAPIPAEIPQLL